MRPRNNAAITLLQKLDTAGMANMAAPGYFGTSSYCVGIEVQNVADAFRSGVTLGECGPVTFDRIPKYKGFILVFPDAHVTA